MATIRGIDEIIISRELRPRTFGQKGDNNSPFTLSINDTLCSPAFTDP